VFDCVKLCHFSKEERKMQKCASLQKKDAGHCLYCAQLSVFEKVFMKKKIYIYIYGKGGRILCRKD